MSQSDPPRVLSLTPAPLSRDSRALKAAMAYARAGFDSRVIEGLASAKEWDGWPIRVRAVRRGEPQLLRGIGHRGLRNRRDGPFAFIIFLAYLAYYLLNYGLRPLINMRRATLFHLHSYEYFPLVRLWTALFGGRYVYDAHDFYADLDPRVDALPAQRQWIRPFQRWIERHCIRGAAAVLVVSDGIAALVEAHYGRRPDVIRNCHDLRLDGKSPRTLREASGLDKDAFLVVSVGHYKPGMAVEEALEALASLPPRVHLAFVGGGYEFDESIARLGLTGRVHALGAMPASEVVPLIEGADAALTHYYSYTPNYENALPNGLFQAIAAGLPLVYSPLPQIRRLLEPYGAGIPADAKSPPAIAAAIGRLAGDPAECRRQAEASRRAGEALSFEREEERLIEIVRRIAPLPDPVAARAAFRS
ncbi:MAG TPA: glycosyltransferase [Stellaceae bacterium]|nr:glycosyltransferase [Stellaceae bacterium]